ncbi:TRAP transporter permease [Candidatus Laterigemmans baculatus]|uniref:TRAP transporter permease n=1 Tax=Candidatus Laterigemmans baculatus TaxID=2770505 RepID=UPI0013D99245|nr:TRAP transporter fused permease subunit [Candidatus Laterigemmans baculatus]
MTTRNESRDVSVDTAEASLPSAAEASPPSAAEASPPSAADKSLFERGLHYVVLSLAIVLSLYVLLEVNFSTMSTLAQLALFAAIGLPICFLSYPLHPRLQHVTAVRWLDVGLAILSVACCGYLVVVGSELGQRAANYTELDQWVAGVGLLLVLEATRRAIGLALPLLAILFIVYAHESVARDLPDWLFPHGGQDWEAIFGQTYLRTEGVFGTALNVMFRYVFLFVLFGAFLEASGATQYIISLATRLFGTKSGGPAKVSVLASGLMGSLSGSAVANAATTGTFTIPLMRSSGFKPHIAGAVEAAASSGGALMPPVMGAGAYMMLEIINRNPPVTYLEIMKAALVPAVLYYLSLFLLVHFYARRVHTVSAQPATPVDPEETRILSFEGLTFFGSLGALMGLLMVGYSPFRAVTYALALLVVMILFNPAMRVGIATRLASLLGIVALLVAARFNFTIFHLASSLTVAVSGRELPFPMLGSWDDAIVATLAEVLIVGLLMRAWRGTILDAFQATSRSGIALIVAASCVGIVIGLVSRTGIGTGVPQAIIPLAGNSLFLALVAIMVCSIILGMGLPSAVSYLLLATVIGPVFADPSLGVPILAAHLFIFYFGMMAMVTPPVALAAYATASIAGSSVMQTGLASFRFALVGFTLPYMFVYRPELLLMAADGGPPNILRVLMAITAAVLGILALAAGMAGFYFHRLGWGMRTALFIAAALALYPGQFEMSGYHVPISDIAGLSILAVVTSLSWRQRERRATDTPPAISPA